MKDCTDYSTNDNNNKRIQDRPLKTTSSCLQREANLQKRIKSVSQGCN